MTFTTPLYLLLLLPWAGVVAWVLLGRADFARVSTTQFWDRTETTSQTRRGIRKPPLAMVLLILGALAGILAAGGMTVASPIDVAPITLILDRDPATTAFIKHEGDVPGRIFGGFGGRNGKVDLIALPSDEIETVDHSGTLMWFRNPRATGIDTSRMLRETIDRELRRTDQDIIVVTAKRLSVTDGRVRVVSPTKFLSNAGIEKFEVVETPSAQAMVRVWNGTAKAQATLRVGSAEQVIDLPATGSSKDYFVDLASVGEWVSAELVIDDDIAADDQAYVAKRGAWPRVEARVGLPAGVGRMIEVYQRSRPATPDAPIVAVTGDLGAPGHAIVLAPGAVKAEGSIRAIDHPVTQDVDWPALADLIRGSTNRIAPAGKPVVWVGESPVVVELADRRLWIGFDLAAIAQRPEFVVFLTNAIDFVAAEKPVYASEPARALDGAWKRVDSGSPDDLDAAPGVYRTQDRLLATNVGVAKPEFGDLSPPEPGTRRMVSSSPVPVGGVLLVACLGLVLSAVLRLTRS